MALVLAYMHLYGILINDYFRPFLVKHIKNLVLKRQTETVSIWYQHLLTLFAIFFTRGNTNTVAEGTHFRIMFICFMFVNCACFVSYSTSVRFGLVKSLPGREAGLFDVSAMSGISGLSVDSILFLLSCYSAA